MRTEDRYLKYLLWSEEDAVYVGYCPELFPRVCHADREEEAYRELAALVREEVEELVRSGAPLPEPATRPMCEAVPV